MNPRHLRPSIKEMQRQEAAMNRKIKRAIEEAKLAEALAKEAEREAKVVSDAQEEQSLATIIEN